MQRPGKSIRQEAALKKGMTGWDSAVGTVDKTAGHT
jgi:hypothetical protein